MNSREVGKDYAEGVVALALAEAANIPLYVGLTSAMAATAASAAA